MLDEEGDGLSEETQQAEPREVEPEVGEEREVEPEEEEGKKKGAKTKCYTLGHATTPKPLSSLLWIEMNMFYTGKG